MSRRMNQDKVEENLESNTNSESGGIACAVLNVPGSAFLVVLIGWSPSTYPIEWLKEFCQIEALFANNRAPHKIDVHLYE